MKKEQTPRRMFSVYVATENGCPPWSPIKRSGNDVPPGYSATGTDQVSTPDAAADPWKKVTPGGETER